jgi:hypothetical protein
MKWASYEIYWAYIWYPHTLLTQEFVISCTNEAIRSIICTHVGKHYINKKGGKHEFVKCWKYHKKINHQDILIMNIRLQSCIYLSSPLYIPHTCHNSWICHKNNIWKKVKFMNLLKISIGWDTTPPSPLHQYIPEDRPLHNDHRDNLKPYILVWITLLLNFSTSSLSWLSALRNTRCLNKSNLFSALGWDQVSHLLKTTGKTVF